MAEAKKTTKKAAKEAELTVETVKQDEVPDLKMAVDASPDEKVTAKAGKRSAKAAREEEQKEAKQARKDESKQAEAIKTAKPTIPPRTRLERSGKKYREAAKLVEAGKLYDLKAALELASKSSPTKFDATIELHINLGVDPKQADQNVRDTVVMPAGTGKDVRVVTLDESSAEKVFAKLDKEDIDFDVLVATPAMMPRLGKYARLLGPRGLMPNPKSGTVTNDVATAAKEAKAGKVEYRVDQAGIVHLAVGKASFSPDQLYQNAEAVLASVRSAKPASVKGIYIKSAYVSSTMGPSVRLDLSA